MQFHKPKKKLQNHFIFRFMIFKFDLKLSKFQQFKKKASKNSSISNFTLFSCNQLLESLHIAKDTFCVVDFSSVFKLWHDISMWKVVLEAVFHRRMKGTSALQLQALAQGIVLQNILWTCAHNMVVDFDIQVVVTRCFTL
jgi:hypothetical protein